jgi:hypothetical protein
LEIFTSRYWLSVSCIYRPHSSIDSLTPDEFIEILNLIGELYRVLPNNEEVLRTQTKWEFSLKKHPEKVLNIYLINEDSLSVLGTCKVLKEQVFIKRFDLAYDDLERMNWRIIYDRK